MKIDPIDEGPLRMLRDVLRERAQTPTITAGALAELLDVALARPSVPEALEEHHNCGHLWFRRDHDTCPVCPEIAAAREAGRRERDAEVRALERELTLARAEPEQALVEIPTCKECAKPAMRWGTFAQCWEHDTDAQPTVNAAQVAGLKENAAALRRALQAARQERDTYRAVERETQACLDKAHADLARVTAERDEAMTTKCGAHPGGRTTCGRCFTNLEADLLTARSALAEAQAKLEAEHHVSLHFNAGQIEAEREVERLRKELAADNARRIPDAYAGGHAAGRREGIKAAVAAIHSAFAECRPEAAPVDDIDTLRVGGIWLHRTANILRNRRMVWLHRKCRNCGISMAGGHFCSPGCQDTYSEVGGAFAIGPDPRTLPETPPQPLKDADQAPNDVATWAASPEGQKAASDKAEEMIQALDKARRIELADWTAPVSPQDAAPATAKEGRNFIDIVFDGPPGPEAGRFVEVEDSTGHSIKFGEWVHRADGYWTLRILDGVMPPPQPLKDAAPATASPDASPADPSEAGGEFLVARLRLLARIFREPSTVTLSNPATEAVYLDRAADALEAATTDADRRVIEERETCIAILQRLIDGSEVKRAQVSSPISKDCWAARSAGLKDARDSIQARAKKGE